MNIDSVSDYDVLAQAFKVIDIATPINIVIPLNSTIDHALEEMMMDDQSWFSLVGDDSCTYGYLTLDGDYMEMGSDTKVSEALEPLYPEKIVPSSLTVLDLLPYFEKNYFLFILTGNKITHVVSFQSLDVLPVKLCLFTLIMGLESQMTRLLMINPEKSLSFLSDNRIKKAMEIYRNKNKETDRKADSNKLIYSTTFIDKYKMLKRSPLIVSKLPFQNKKEVDSYFSLVQDVRNFIAHGKPILEILSSPEEFNSFIKTLRKIISELSATTEYYGKNEHLIRLD